MLSPDEQMRRQSFRRPLSAHNFLLQRILLRQALAQYVGSEPHQLEFAAGPLGKPILMHPVSKGLCFSLSHVGALAVLAIARGHGLGVDVEAWTRADAAMRISAHFFSHAERAQLGRSDAASYDALKLWALKESAVKAIGGTIWDGLSKTAFSIEAKEIRWLSLPPTGDKDNWAMMLGRVCSTHVISVALNAPQAGRQFYKWRSFTLGNEKSSGNDVELLRTSEKS